MIFHIFRFAKNIVLQFDESRGMRESLLYFSVTRERKKIKIFKENQQFYIGIVHEEIISAWKDVRNVSINFLNVKDKVFTSHPMRASPRHFCVTRYVKRNKILKENQLFYIGKVHEEII